MFDILTMELELMVLYLVIVIANTITGMHYNINIKNLKFDWTTLINGVLKALVIGFGTILGTVPIAMMPHILKDLNIQISYSDEISVLIIFTVIITGIFHYSKSFIQNLKNIYKGGKENE